MIKKYLLVLIFITGLITTFFIPPFAKPDEPIHFAKSLEVSKGKIFCKNGEEYKINKKYNKIHELSNKYGLAGNNVYTFPISEYKINLFDRENQYIKAKTSYCYLNSLPYLISGFGLWLGDIIRLNGIFSFFLGRFLNFIFVFIIISIIIIKSEKFFWIFFLPLALPITLQQLSSYSYDGITILCFYLFFYFFLKNNKENLKFIFLSSLFLILAILSKNLFYFPLILILFLNLEQIKKIKIKKLRIKIFILFILIFSFVFLAYLILYKIIIPTLKTNNDVIFKSTIDPNMQLYILKTYPQYFIQVFFNNLYEKQFFLISSLIGNMEWLNFTLSPIILFIYFSLIIKVITMKLNHAIKPYKIFYIFFNILIFVFLIFLYLYLTWTPIGSSVIEGFQSRYIIPLLPLLIYCLNYLYNKFKKLFIILTFIFILFIVSFDFYKRHYDYSKAVDTNNLPKFSNEKLSINKEFYQIIEAKNKKILALYFYYNGKIPNPPLSIEIYDKNCHKRINYNIVPTSKLNKGENIIFIKPLKSNNKYCIKFNTFNLNLKNKDLLLNKILKNEDALYPLYSY